MLGKLVAENSAANVFRRHDCPVGPGSKALDPGFPTGPGAGAWSDVSAE